MGDHFLYRNIGNEGVPVLAPALETVESADRAFQPPREERAMARAGERSGIDEVKAPIDAHGRCAHRRCQMQWS